jgi:hypothetical protein
LARYHSPIIVFNLIIELLINIHPDLMVTLCPSAGQKIFSKSMKSNFFIRVLRSLSVMGFAMAVDLYHDPRLYIQRRLIQYTPA